MFWSVRFWKAIPSFWGPNFWGHSGIVTPTDGPRRNFEAVPQLSNFECILP